MRALATIRKIEAINPIENADAIDVASIGGWNVVVKKESHSVNELVCYLEIDSWVPEHLAPFLGASGVPAKTYEEVVGFRLKSKKLRGVVSQGLILPISACKELDGLELVEDQDVTDILNVKKYEQAVAANLAGFARGNFPSFIPKTDAERIQNLKRDLNDWNERRLTFEVTEKLDGTSCTMYHYDKLAEDGKDIVGVCSRNIDLKDTEGNTYWTVAKATGIVALLHSLQQNIAIQGEIIGGGIQGDKYNFKTGHHFFVFNIFNIDTQKYFTPAERLEFCRQHNLTLAPIIHHDFVIGNTVEGLLSMATGGSAINVTSNIAYQCLREGLVFKCNEIPSISFKAISNEWLLKYDK